jgi:hypothetical protein
LNRVAAGLIVWASVCGGAAGCGKSLVPGSTYDHALLSFSGRILPKGGLADTKHPMVTLLWTDPYQKQRDVPMPVAWLRSTVPPPAEDATTADTFTVDVFRPPPPEALVDVPLSSNHADVARLAIAEIVLFDDRDDDETLQVTGPRADIVGKDRFLAGSTFVLTYVERPYATPGAANPLTVPTKSGYQLVSYDCDGRISAGTVPWDAGAVDLIAQRSTSFPEVRNCRRTHSP